MEKYKHKEKKTSSLQFVLFLVPLETPAFKGQRVSSSPGPSRVLLSLAAAAAAARVPEDDHPRLGVLKPLCKVRRERLAVLVLLLLLLLLLRMQMRGTGRPDSRAAAAAAAAAAACGNDGKMGSPDSLGEKVEEAGVANDGDVPLRPRQQPPRELEGAGLDGLLGLALSRRGGLVQRVLLALDEGEVDAGEGLALLGNREAAVAGVEPALLAAELERDEREAPVGRERRRGRDPAGDRRAAPHQETPFFAPSLGIFFFFFFLVVIIMQRLPEDRARGLERPRQRGDHDQLRARQQRRGRRTARRRSARVDRPPVLPRRLGLPPPAPREVRVPVKLRFVALAVALARGVVVALGVADEGQEFGVPAKGEEEGREGRRRRRDVVVVLLLLFFNRQRRCSVFARAVSCLRELFCLLSLCVGSCKRPRGAIGGIRSRSWGRQRHWEGWKLSERNSEANRWQDHATQQKKRKKKKKKDTDALFFPSQPPRRYYSSSSSAMSRPAARALQSLLFSRAAAGRELGAGGNGGRRCQELSPIVAAAMQQATSTTSTSTTLPLLLRRYAGSSAALPFPSASSSSSSISSTAGRSRSDSAFSFALQQQQLRRQHSSSTSSSSSSSNPTAAGEESEAAAASSSSPEERVVPEAEAGAAAAAASGDEDASPEALRAALDETAALLAASEASASELRDRLARSAADMENLRARTARQAESARAFAVQSLVKDLLDVADNLSRAREAASSSGSGGGGGNGGSDSSSSSAPERLASLVQGVELTERVLLSAFRSAGVEPFEPRGEAFDPNEMEAMFEVPVSAAAAAATAGGGGGGGEEPAPAPGHVAVVTKKGYKLNGRVVRPAQVGVFKG